MTPWPQILSASDARARGLGAVLSLTPSHLTEVLRWTVADLKTWLRGLKGKKSARRVIEACRALLEGREDTDPAFPSRKRGADGQVRNVNRFTAWRLVKEGIGVSPRALRMMYWTKMQRSAQAAWKLICGFVRPEAPSPVVETSSEPVEAPEDPWWWAFI